MRVLIIGSLSGPLGTAARMAVATGARLHQCDTIPLALAQLRAQPQIDVVLCDLAHDLPGLVRALSAERIAVPVIACGIDVSPDLASRAIRDGAHDFLALPPDPELIAALLQAISGESHVLVARDPAMLETLQRARQVAGSDASILISGESGTGKEILARYLHRHSKRSAGPFVALNCAAIPENLIESELFGHEKGAFSGAISRRIGRFESADGGTLLLDEISEMDIRLQAKLLRALQEREIDRLGGTNPVRVNVRILATSNRDLPADVVAGRFREDLYFRLNVISLRIPPLRERPADVVALADHFARHYAEVNGLPYRRLSEAAIVRLAGNPWRGNVRELENTLHRAVLLATESTIEEDVIEPAAQNKRQSHAIIDEAQIPSKINTVEAFIGTSMQDLEREFIIQTLRHTSGNRTHAATLLGISIRALRNKLREYSAQGKNIPAPRHGLIA